jgi:hypothetical protein
MAESYPKKKVKLAMVDNFVKEHAPPSSNSTAALKPTAKKGGRRSQPPRRKLPINPPPIPANGHTYGVGEFLKHAFAREPGRERGAFIRSVNDVFIGDTKAKNTHRYVKASRASVYRAIKEHIKGPRFEGDKEWNHVGRPALLKDA